MLNSRPLLQFRIVIILLCTPTPVATEQNRHTAMANAMTSMMDAMGMWFNQVGPNNNWQNIPYSAQNSSPIPWQANGSASWNNPAHWSGIGPAPVTATPWSWGLNPVSSSPWLPQIFDGLDGVWIGNSGERFTVQGRKFFLDHYGRRVSGILQISDRTLALFQPQLNVTSFYEYVHHDGKLALRDGQGQVLLYRRSQ